MNAPTCWRVIAFIIALLDAMSHGRTDGMRQPLIPHQWASIAVLCCLHLQPITQAATQNLYYIAEFSLQCRHFFSILSEITLAEYQIVLFFVCAQFFQISPTWTRKSLCPEFRGCNIKFQIFLLLCFFLLATIIHYINSYIISMA